MIKKFLLNNKYFFLLFIVWVVCGGILLYIFSQEELFFFANSHHSFFLDNVMVVLSGFGRGDCIPFIITSLYLLPTFRNLHYLISSLLFAVLVPLFSFYLKNEYNCPRPLTVYGIQKVHTVSWLDNAFYHSFPSGHTIGAFALFLFLSLYLPAKQKIWSIFFFTLALGCGYSRMYLGQHFFKDIYAGSIFGVFIIAFIYLVADFISIKTTKK